MSLSSYIRRQSRVIRRSTVVSGAGLTSILEEPESSTEKKSKKNSTKAKRRLGVSDLSIPQTSPLFTAVQGLDDAEWRLRLPLDDPKEDATFDFPRPPLPIFEPISDESESSGSESGEGSSSGSESPMSSLPTTPTPSPTAESYDAAELQGQCVIRCKSIKPLTITKRSVSPIPPVPSSSALPSCSVSPPSPQAADEDAWQDDDEYYTAHASNFITLTAPLPPSFPISAASPTVSTARASRRESAIIPTSSTAAPIRPSGQLDPAYTPQRGSVRLSRPISIPSRAPPPPPIITSGCHVRSGSAPVQTPALPERPSRPPPRTPVPMDAVSTPWSGDYTAYAPLFTPSPSASSSSSSSRLAALLSPPPQHFPAETQGVPCDVDEDDDDWEECVYEYDEVPLSPLIASAPSPESDELSPELEATEPAVEESEKWTFPPSPLPVPGPYTGWHPRPRASQLRLAVEPLLSAANSPSSASPQQDRIPPRTPALRSQWSSSTLSSIHSAHAHARSPASPKTFSFARRYFPKAKSPSSTSKSPRAYPKPMGSATILSPKKRGKGGNGKRLTVDDVLIIGPPPVPTTPFCALSPATPATPYSASAQWAAYPASPAPVPVPCLANAGASLTRSPALYAAYSTQRSPRRRASTSSDWSYSSASASGSDSGHSDASTGSAGLKRKPIPVEMFLRK